MAVAGVRCDDWFGRWQDAKLERRAVARVGNGRAGAASTAARDRAQWLMWWSPSIGDQLPQTVGEPDLLAVFQRMEAARRAPNTIRTHWG
jgi:hypothetical protein